MTPGLREDRATELRLIARLGGSPRYAGSIHDDGTARRFGYRGALIPGAFLYGYMSRLAVAAWGETWLQRGTMQSRSLRPVYDGDALIVIAAPLRHAACVLGTEMTVHDETGRLVADGAATLPDVPPSATAAGPVLPIAADPPAVAPGGLQPGDTFGSLGEIVTAAEHRQSLDDFGETWPGYGDRGIIHPGMLLRLAMRDAIASYRYPTTGIFVSAHTQFLGLAKAGDRVQTSGAVTAAYERNGNHYYDSGQHVAVGDGRPVAFMRRSAIYAVRQRRAA